MQQLIVGVLGGLGPEATLDFYARLLTRTRAATDQEHLHLIIDSNPKVPNRNDALAGIGPSPGPHLANMAVALEKAGADFLVMVCNTAHAWQHEIASASSLPFISIIDETVRATISGHPDVRTVGLLAATGCLDAGLYQDAFAAHGVTTVEPDRDRFMDLLYRIKAADTGPAVRKAMSTMANELAAEVIVSACTEVPLVLSQKDLTVPLIHSTDVLVDATIAVASGLRSLDIPDGATG